MDILNNICLCVLFLPLLFGIYLIYSRAALVSVKKGVLKWGILGINILCFAASSAFLYNILFNNITVNLSTEVFSIGELNFNFGFLIDKTNISFLIYAAFTYVLAALFSKIYFDKKKQFLFTKQRYHVFLSLLSFNTYLFIISENLFQSLIFWILQGLIIFVFSYFDLFKNSVNYNITRFARITLLADFALILASLILFKYAVISEGYINSTSLDFNSLNILTSYTYGISSYVEFYLIFACLVIAFASKLFIFPLSCYYSFFANSSNVFYASILTAANTILGLSLFLKTIPYFELLDNINVHLVIFFMVCAIISAIFIIFEKNIKIIFGYIISALNAIFVGTYILYQNNIVIYSFYAVNILILLIVMGLFIKDKSNLKSALIKKRSGFILERFHIFIFETLPSYLFNLFNFIDEKILQNIVYFIVKIFSIFSTIFVIKISKQDKFTKIRSIFIIFALYAMIAIFIALFGRYNAGFIK